MHFTYTTLLCVAAHLALVNAAALPAAKDYAAHQQHQPRAGGGGGGGGGAGGILQILTDHGKYMANPASAEEPIPEAKNNEMREMHRQAHKTIYETMLGGDKDKAGKDKEGAGQDKEGAGQDKEEAGQDKDAAPAKETDKAAAV
ncbi:hypothetical protein BBAD15_g4609 [Beauveria bassiana D1-5]|uniref:Uncharacterized protein n=1 Tax=Beauveria bassiana D1-5 TaxID=1245745 RepID=A0A0A2VUL2_BEABA|nr:hypothetical protein BBAD15_g4609 [Beauveria bassiana D1-5]